MAPLHQLRCTNKNSFYTLRHHSLCLLNLPSFGGGEGWRRKIMCLSPPCYSTDLGSEPAGLSAHRTRIRILQYFSCKAQSSSLALGHTFLCIYFPVFKEGSWGNRSSFTPLLPGKKRSYPLRDANPFSRGLLELLLQEALERSRQICSTPAAYLTCKVRQEEGWERAETNISQALRKHAC